MSDPGRGGVRRRRSRRQRGIRIARGAALAFGFLAVLVITGLLLIHRSDNSVSIPNRAEWSQNPSVNLALLAAQSGTHARSADSQRPARPVYNYSVVSGGVRSGAELRQAAARDRSVAEHYAGFGYERARIVRLKAPKLVYLSYRMNGRILWTKARHRLPEGESVLSDGEMMARTRCANQISLRKRLPVAAAEPTAAQLEELIPQIAPPVRLDAPAQFQSALLSPPNEPGGPPAPQSPISAPPLLGGIPWLPPPVPVAGGGECEPPHDGENGGSQNPACPPPTPPPPPPPAPVPEPGSILLVSSGVAAIAALYRKKRAAR